MHGSRRARHLASCLSLLLAACQVAPEAGASCTRAGDCAAPLVCAFGRCRAECATTRDCPVGAECLLDAVGAGACALPSRDGCTPVASPCTEGLVCAGTTCRQPCDGRACASGSTCTSMGGLAVCVADVVDASLPDAAIDTGTEPDASELDAGDAMPMDAGPCATPAAPRLLSPANGATTGSALHPGSLRPTFRWAASGACTMHYEIEIDDSCGGAIASCTFASPEHRATVPDTSTALDADLAVSTAAPVGRRYYWHVRACSSANCGPWSDVRYLDVGRVPSDFDGDGYSDVAVGAMLFDGTLADEGRVFVFRGSASGVSSTPDQTLTSPHAQSGGSFGCSVSSADVNGDGFADLLVGAYKEDGTAADEGRAYYYAGGPGMLSTPPEMLVSPAHDPMANFGVQLASAGDLDADGFADVVVGAYQAGPPMAAGAAFVYRGGVGVIAGAAGETPWLRIDDPAHQVGANFGVSVASAGDVNADGYGDLVVGAYYEDVATGDEGSAYVFYGSASGVRASPDVSLHDPGDQPSAVFGTSVTTAGDVNGDGYDDVAVGASYQTAGASNDGSTFLYAGSESGLGSAPYARLDDPGAEANARFGWAVTAAGDVDGDGLGDLLVGAYLQGGTQEGRAFVYLGDASAFPTTPSVVLTSPTGHARAWYGGAVSAAGDVNGDGLGDLVIGAEQESMGAMQEGAAFVLHGAAGGPSPVPSRILDCPGNQRGADFGYSVE